MTGIILDCDPGVDDAIALALAVASPEIRLRAVTAVAGNRPVETTSRNARRLLDLLGAGDIPVYAGAARSLAYSEPRCSTSHGEDGLGGIDIGSGNSIGSDHATDIIAAALAGPQGAELTLVAVGPLTNLALVEIKYPGLLARAAAILVMGGAAFTAGNITPAAEFNFWSDPLAAHVVLSSGADLRIFGLDVTSRVAMTPDFLGRLARGGGNSARKLHDMLKVYGRSDPLLHDTCPVAFLVEPGMFTSERGYMQIDWSPGLGEGRSHFWPEMMETRPKPSNVSVVTHVDNGALLTLLEERLVRLP
ncbi:nucleoside hydrolase [Pseudaminobacter sp. 19-2017]|uniref:Nucleoside hydrolase n=1 Tax=Pseudaminobacter soli (ex Zhang et al. 2022) TaxID=2831468 RepID=A0A942E7K7_9HYPH|nr:nucleoside hydrolase [Pseudaminobacter soli]MBS3652406.1 nucleoside hydrolase [Pseudaminobacter soli]